MLKWGKVYLRLTQEGSEMVESPKPPSEPFEPFKPGGAEPWDVRRANHLLRRAGFGPTHDTLTAALKQSPQQAVDGLLNYDVDSDPMQDLVDQLEGFVNFTNVQQVQSYWYFRMVHTPRPMQEKIALVWHNHFATGANKVRQGRYMAGQIDTFRKLGLASFRDLLVAVGKDPAMLLWLDGNTSKKGAPNENYAREVMELFSLGHGNYTETDVRELARAFTGWQIREEAAFFNKNLFDDGEKTILGETGKFDADSAVDLLLRQPAAPKFIARRLLREFVHPEPADAHVEHYAKRLVAHKWQIKPVLREMLTSRLFFSDWSYRSKIKSPVELTVGVARVVGGRVNTDILRDMTNRMGQSILNPPDVSGWKGEQAWINANTLLLRMNFALSMAHQRQNEFVRPADLAKWLGEHNLKTADAILDHYLNLLVDGTVSSEQRQALLDYMNRDRKNEPGKFEFKGDWINAKARGVVHLILTLPEAQLA